MHIYAHADALWYQLPDHWLPARWASGFSGDHQQDHQCLWFPSCYIMLLMYSVLHCLYSVGNKITTTIRSKESKGRYFRSPWSVPKYQQSHTRALKTCFVIIMQETPRFYLSGIWPNCYWSSSFAGGHSNMTLLFGPRRTARPCTPCSYIGAWHRSPSYRLFHRA